MISFLIRRFGQSIAVIAGVLITTFVMIHLLPGSPARATLGARATPVAIAAFNHANGYDRPLVDQFLAYVSRVIHGNLGFSYLQNQSVIDLIKELLPKDIILVGFAYAIALVVAIPLGVYQAVRRNRAGDYIATGFAFILYSMPSFFLAFLLIAAFSVKFRVFAAEAPQGGSVGSILSDPRGLVLPVLTLALITIAQFSRYMRSSAIENLAQDYIRTARAKGMSERTVLIRHLTRNCLVPIVTLLGLSLPVVVSGALVIEDVYNYPGMGLEFFKAATTQDYPVLLGFTLFIGVATVLGNLFADLGYVMLDPRVRLG
jgi:peptide/nickel transport system permease protein